jgi:hypothetical protein
VPIFENTAGCELIFENLRLFVMNRCVIFVIPRDVLALVANFLLPENEQHKRIFKYSFDWRNFMITSKRHLEDWKCNSQLVALTPYYSDKFGKSSVFREAVSQIVINPLEQLELKFTSTKSESPVESLGIVKKLEVHKFLEGYPVQLDELILVVPNLQSIHLEDCPPVRKLGITWLHLISLDVANDIPTSLLQGLREVSLNFVTIVNYSRGFSHLESLSIWNCPSLRDVSCFGAIRRLSIDNCRGITDVSSLRNVVELRLSCCDGIRDVSALGKVYHLDLSDCDNVADVSLGKCPYSEFKLLLFGNGCFCSEECL